MKYSLLLVLVITILNSCKKENSDAPLMMRIRNISGNTFSYSYASGKEFGIITNGTATRYKEFENIIAYAGASIAIGTDTSHAGLLYCGTPPLPMLENGKYTLEIFEDNSIVPGYLNAKFIKDE